MVAGDWATGNRRRCAQFGVVICLACGLAIAGAGCSGTSKRVETEPAALAGEELQRAERLYDQMHREHDLHLDRKALELGFELVDRYPTFAHNDDVLRMAIVSARRVGDLTLALRLVDEFGTMFPASPLAPTVLELGVEAADEAGDPLRAAHLLLDLYDTQSDAFARQRIARDLEQRLADLSAGDIYVLFAVRTESDLWTWLGLQQVNAALREGLYPSAERTVADMAAAGASDGNFEAAQLLLADPTRATSYVASAPVDPSSVGILCPVTGRYAVMGNACYDGARLAVDRVNAEYGTSFQLQLEDTEADPVTAALAAKRLSLEQGCIGLIGGLLSTPTAAAAVVADFTSVPLISPTATHGGIWRLGDSVFQTNQTAVYEAQLLAELVCSILLKKRFAVIHPRDRAGEDDLAVFAEAVERWGGEIVATADFAPEATDFRGQIAELKRMRPEVIYVPATVDQTIMLGPQLDFHQVGALVVGPSTWNAPKLLRNAGTVMQRALFPDDLALFPEQWTDEFQTGWRQDLYPDETTRLAQRTYQATRLMLDTLVQSGAAGRGQLAEALRSRLANREEATAGPESFARGVRMIVGEEVVPFPAARFSDGWRLTEGAALDSLRLEGSQLEGSTAIE